MTDARCVPPDGADDGSDHYCSPTGLWEHAEPMRWRSGYWICLGVGGSGGLLPEVRGKWTYLAPIDRPPTSPAELARLREIEAAAREERATNSAYDRAVVCGMPDYHERYQRFCAARDRLTAALGER